MPSLGQTPTETSPRVGLFPHPIILPACVDPVSVQVVYRPSRFEAVPT